MTTEHNPVDLAIAKAVFTRVYGEGHFDPSVLPESSLIEAARMARMGEVPVDPLVLEVREILANITENHSAPSSAKAYREGRLDHFWAFEGSLACMKRGVEIGKGRK